MHSPWLQQLLEQPRVFCQWFAYLRYPGDLFRGISFIFEMVMFAKMDLVLHPDYLEVFTAPDAHDNDALRIRRAALIPADAKFLGELEDARREVFNKVVVIPSGRKYIYSQFKLGALEIDRRRLLTIISSHLLSCLPVVPILKVLTRIARTLALDALYGQLYSDELYTKLLMSSSSPLRCDECGKVSASAVPGQSWEARWARLDGFAAELAAAHTSGSPRYNFYRWRQAIINAIEDPAGQPHHPEARAAADRLLLGHEPGAAAAPAAATGVPPGLRVVRQKHYGTPYGGKEPTGRTAPGARHPQRLGVSVWHGAPLRIYPAGHYGGQYRVVLAGPDRVWQISHAVFTAAQAVSTSDPQPYFVPLAAALWSMIEEGTPALLVKTLQLWLLPTLADREQPLRCFQPTNWAHLRDLLDSLYEQRMLPEREFFKYAAFLLACFVDPRTRYYGSQEADDAFWAEALKTRDVEKLACLSAVAYKKKAPKSAEIPEIDTAERAPGGRLPVPFFVCPLGENELGYQKHSYNDLEPHPLLKLFYIMECKRRGLTELYISENPMHDVADAPSLEACWVMLHLPGEKVTKPYPLRELTVIADWEMPCLEPPRPAQPALDPCPRNHPRRRSVGAATPPLPPPPAPPAPHEEARRAAREERERLQLQSDRHAKERQAEVQHHLLFQLQQNLTEAGVAGVLFVDGGLRGSDGTLYELEKKGYFVAITPTQERHRCMNMPDKVAAWVASRR
jgi:hypothetical protein